MHEGNVLWAKVVDLIGSKKMLELLERAGHVPNAFAEFDGVSTPSIVPKLDHRQFGQFGEPSNWSAKGTSDSPMLNPCLRSTKGVTDEPRAVDSGTNIMGHEEGEDTPVAEQFYHEVVFEVALDSGSIANVCSDGDTPGYSIVESEASKAGRHLVVGDGGRLPNQGQKDLNLAPEESDINTVFQIANVTRPLMSVGKMCDGGLRIMLDDKEAVVTNKQGKVVC